ncbi:MAG: DUF4139 domain-containing protein [Planctomycetes bacterium]|nr:DUF4139 domain-containing protein [Planctomycetota bacterium]
MLKLRVALALTLVSGLCFALPDRAALGAGGEWAERGIEAAEARNADKGEATLPITRITLYRSGVASFERSGSVAGDSTLRLRFDNAQVNDVLKSLVAADMSGKGSVRGVSYASNAPLARRLAAFGINLGDDPSMGVLLGRLRGAEVKVTSANGTVTGTILGSEVREEASGNAQKTIQVPFLNVVGKGGIHSVNLFEARSIELTDPDLQAELTKALTAIAQQRQEQSRSLDVSFAGTGDREVAVMYTHESPVWKASYRVLLDEKAPTRMSGWAIIENTTDEDWTDVRLSLVSGRPVSFTMDLQEPLFAWRPNVAVPSVGGMMPRVYEDSMIDRSFTQSNQKDELQAAARKMAIANRGQSVENKRQFSMSEAAPASPALDQSLRERDASMGGSLSASMPAGAGGVVTGEVFHYDVSTPTTIARQSSAMIPIVGADVKTRRVSILSPGPANQTRYPMRGMELTNSTDLQLLPGPLAIYDSGVYAGDSMIEQIGPGDTRLVSYATDLEVVAVTDESSSNDMKRLRIVQGSFEMRSVSTQTTTYKLRNKSEKASRTVILEQPRLGGYKLIDSLKPTSETASLYRFEVELKPGEKKDFTVVQESAGVTTVGINSYDDRTILAWQQSGKLSPKVLETFREVAKRQAAIKSLERKSSDLDAEWKRISEDQARTRANMQAIDRNSDLYARYMKKLGEQETQGEQIGADNINTRNELRKQQEELNKFLSDLTVE